MYIYSCIQIITTVPFYTLEDLFINSWYGCIKSLYVCIHYSFSLKQWLFIAVSRYIWYMYRQFEAYNYIWISMLFEILLCLRHWLTYLTCSTPMPMICWCNNLEHQQSWYGHHDLVNIAKLFNSLRPRPNRRHFADDNFKRIFENENEWISPRNSLKFVPGVRINNIPALVQIMAWRRPGDKPLSETMMVRLPTHICVARPQWVNEEIYRKSFRAASLAKLGKMSYKNTNVRCL